MGGVTSVRRMHTPERAHRPVSQSWGRFSTPRRPYPPRRGRIPSGRGATAGGEAPQCPPRFAADPGCPGRCPGTEGRPPGTHCSLKALQCLAAATDRKVPIKGSIANHMVAHSHKHTIPHEMVGGQRVLGRLQRNLCPRNDSGTYHPALLLLQPCYLVSQCRIVL